MTSIDINDLLPMEVVALDDDEHLFLSPAITDWTPITDRAITVIIDLEGGLDHGVPTVPGHVLYVYFPIYDEGVPNEAKLHAVATLGANLIRQGHRVLSHCGLGLNRSALVAGLILVYLGHSGPAAVQRIQERRAGALYNENFARYLASLTGPPDTRAGQ